MSKQKKHECGECGEETVRVICPECGSRVRELTPEELERVGETPTIDAYVLAKKAEEASTGSPEDRRHTPDK